MRTRLLPGIFLMISTLAAGVDLSLQQETDRAIGRGLEFLGQQQQPDGSWRQHPGITGLVTLAFLQSPGGSTPEYEKRTAGGLKFILSCIKSDGAIYGGAPADPYPNYSTAISLMTLLAAQKPEHVEAIRHARDYLLRSQFDERKGVSKGDPSYGGIGYGRDQRPDLSNTALALEALHMAEQIQTVQASPSERKKTSLYWEKALSFLAHCQNLSAVNTNVSANAEDTGGFYSGPAESPGPSTTNANHRVSFQSYGSVTYAGIKSLLDAPLTREDPRIRAALDWGRRHWTFAENPGLGSQGLFGYFRTIAKALDTLGEPAITDDKGTAHDWRKEILESLLGLQRDGSFWQNPAGLGEESDKVLATAYALLALETARGK